MFEADPTPAEQIERLEAQIDELREAIRRSRRLVVAGRACAFAGAALLICLALGLATVTPVRMIVGIAVGLGGLVLMGSSVGSTKQLELSLKQTEDERNAAIDALEFVDLGDGRPLISQRRPVRTQGVAFEARLADSSRRFKSHIRREGDPRRAAVARAMKVRRTVDGVR